MVEDENEFGLKNIPNEALTLAMIPVPGESTIWEIMEFALSFDGYEFHGSFEACADIANRALDLYRKNGHLPQSLIELRTCLFFEQRRWRHYDQTPEGEDRKYFDTLLAAIRKNVEEIDR